MSRLEEIKDEFAEFHGHNDWKDLWYSDSNYNRSNEMIDSVMKKYATECVKASLDKASENAECDARDYNDYFVDKESITNESNIVLL